MSDRIFPALCRVCFLAVWLILLQSNTAWASDPGDADPSLLSSKWTPASHGLRTTVESVKSEEFCTGAPHRLCLGQDRFSVEVEWANFEGASGTAMAVPFQTDDSGLLWFFSANNWEMLVKVLDGCDLNQHFWVFSAASTNVEYTLRVTDHGSGIVRTYFNPLGNDAPALTDTDALPTCDVAGGRPSVMMFANPTTIPVFGTSSLTLLARDASGDPVPAGTPIELETNLGQVTPEVLAGYGGEATATFTAGPQSGRATVTAILDGNASGAIELTILEVPNSELLIFSNPSVIAIEGTSRISILARDTQGLPLHDRRIRFFADLGDVEPSEVLTDGFGEAEVTFTAGPRAGLGSVTATMNGSDPAGLALTIRDAPAGLALTTDRALIIRLENGQEVTLSVQVFNGLGEGFPGLAVVIESERGTLDSEVVHTDAQGRASTGLLVKAQDVEDIPEGGTFRVFAKVMAEGVFLQEILELTVLGAP